MLRQQEQQQTAETLAAREAEVQELKARVAELEDLQKKQNELIALKDSELAAAQQALGKVQDGAGPAASATSLAPWLAVAIGLVLIALVAVWWLRRRAAQTAPAATKRDLGPLVAAIPKPADDAFVDEAPLEPETPAWSRSAPPPESEPPKPAAPAREVPTWHSGGADIGPLNPAPPGQGRLDLAKAYLEMGDRDTARSLLLEVATRGDTVEVRREAEALLQELG